MYARLHQLKDHNTIGTVSSYHTSQEVHCNSDVSVALQLPSSVNKDVNDIHIWPLRLFKQTTYINYICTSTVQLHMYKYSTATYVQVQYSYICTSTVQLHMYKYSTATYVQVQYSYICTSTVQLHMYKYSTATYVQVQYSYICTSTVQLHMYKYSTATYVQGCTHFLADKTKVAETS